MKNLVYLIQLRYGQSILPTMAFLVGMLCLHSPSSWAAAPAVPTGFTVPSSDDDGIFTISWNSMAAATYYIVWRSDDGGPFPENEFRINSTGNSTVSFQEYNIPDDNYRYVVAACNADDDCSNFTAAMPITVQSNGEVTN